MTRVLKLLTSIFTWWGGATIGASFHIKRRGVLVGKDEYGNTYYEARDKSDAYDGNKRRWVIYNGYAEASKVTPDWHGWLRHTFANSAVKQMQPQVLQSLLGHSDLRVTSVYVKADAVDLVRGMRAMQRAAGSGTGEAPRRRASAASTTPK